MRIVELYGQREGPNLRQQPREAMLGRDPQRRDQDREQRTDESDTSHSQAPAERGIKQERRQKRHNRSPQQQHRAP
jgi:hypothetical protein